jgi:hypothetical protein
MKMTNDPYTGFHRRMKPDYNGWIFFDVYSITQHEPGTIKYNREWFWQPYDGFTRVGMMEGPFMSPYEAYKDAMNEEYDASAASVNTTNPEGNTANPQIKEEEYDPKVRSTNRE